MQRKFSPSTCRLLGLMLASAIAAVVAAPARANASPPHYTVTDLGTLGGSFSLAYGINNRGQISGFSTLPGDTAEHSFAIRFGEMVDLGTLGGPDSQSFTGLNDWGQVPGVAELAMPDPNDEDFCGIGTHLTCLGFLWTDGVMKPLGTFGGYNSGAAMVNNRGEVAGYAETSVPDPACPPPQFLHYLPAVWRGRHVRSLPLYPGDTEGAAFWINDRGEAVGASGYCAAFDPRYAVPIQPQHALLWRFGRTIDLGSLGGKFNNAAFANNNRSEIVGASDLPGDTAADGIQHAFLWRHGKMVDLGVLPGDQVTAAVAINNHSQITGVSLDEAGNSRGFLWQGGRLYDLNDLIPVDSGMYILHGFGINDRGQIVGFAVIAATGEVHGFLANPARNGSRPRLAGHGAKVKLSARARAQLQHWLRTGTRLPK